MNLMTENANYFCEITNAITLKRKMNRQFGDTTTLTNNSRTR